MIKSPFKFLDTYTREDRNIFFGREREIDELYHRVFESKILLVYGLSGTGKSSLIQCGLANRFQETDWFSLNIRRGKNIIESMNEVIQATVVTPIEDIALTSTGFLKSIRSLFLDYYKPVYFIFDQFEELFIFGNSGEKEAFIEIIKDLAASEVQCRFIFVLREEYLANVTEFEKTIPDFLANRVRIEKITPANAKMVIEGPCQIFDIPVEPGFANALLERLSSSDSEIELTYLQVFLDKIYRRAVKECYRKPLAFKTSFLDDIISVSDVLGSFLDEQIEHFPKPDDALVILKSFISVKGTRRQMTIDEVKNFSISLGYQLAGDTLKGIIQQLIQLRILRDKDQNNRYELRHDALAAVIYKKITVIERDILEIRHFLENAFVIYEKRGKLLAREDLKYIAPYEDKLFLGQSINDFIAKSKKEIFKYRQRLRNYKIAGVLLTIIVLSGFTIWALSEKNEANRLYVKSKASTFNYLSKEVVENNPNTALRLAEYALELDPENTDIHSNIRDIYYNNSFFLSMNPFREGDEIIAISVDGKQVLIARGSIMILTDREGRELQTFEGHGNEIISAAFSPEGNTFLSGSYDRTARLWDIHGNTIQVLRGHGGEVGHVAFTPDGQFLLTSSWDRSSHLWNLSGRRLRSFPGLYLTAISPDGNTLAGASDLRLFMCDLEGRIIQVFEGHHGLIKSLSFSPDGRFLLSGSQDKTARLWDLAGNTLQRFTGHPEAVSKTSFSPEGNLIFTGSKGMLRVWHISGLMQRSFRIQQEINHLAFANGADKIYAATSEGVILILNNSGNLRRLLAGSDETVRFIDFSDNGYYLIVGSFSTVNVWDKHGKFIYSFRNQFDGRTAQILSGTFLHDDRLLLLYDDNRVRIWDIYGNLIRQWGTFPSTLVCASPDSRNVLINSLDNTFSLYDNSGNLIRTISGHSGTVISMTFSGDGNKILTGAMDNTARLWNINGELLAELKGHFGPVGAVAFSSDNKTIFTGSAHRTETFADVRGVPRLLGEYTADDNSIRSWCMNGNQLHINRSLHKSIRSVAFNTENNSALIGLENNMAKVVSVNGQEFQTFDGHSGHVTTVAYSPDEKTFVSADQDVFLWDIMQSYEEFQVQNDYESLSICDKIRFNIIESNEVLRFRDEEELLKAAECYFESAASLQHDKRLYYLKNSLQIYDKLSSRFGSAIYILRMIEVYYLLEQIKPSGKFVNSVANLINKLAEPDDPQVLLKYAKFFSTLSEKTNDNHQKQFLLSSSAVFFKKIINDYPQTEIKIEASEVFQSLTLASIRNGEYTAALKHAENGMSINDNLSMEAHLTVSHLFIQDYEAARKIIKKNDFDVLQGIRFRQELRSVLEVLEQDGLIHTDRSAIMAILNLD